MIQLLVLNSGLCHPRLRLALLPSYHPQIGCGIRDRRLCCKVAGERLLAPIQRYCTYRLHGDGHRCAVSRSGLCFFFSEVMASHSIAVGFP
jgi:hypothetical protein